MTRGDTSQRFIFEHTDIRGELVCLTSSYHDTVAGHEYPPAVRRLLGEFLAAAVLLSTTIKYEGRLVLQARGNGEVSLLMAECTSSGELRGIVRYAEEPVTETFTGLMGKGTLAITVDSKNTEPYQGIVDLNSNCLAECLEQYFQKSEQLATQFMFAADDDRVKAMMLQQLPAQLEKDAGRRAEQWRHVLVLAETVSPVELVRTDNEVLLHRLFHEDPLRLFPPASVRYQCSCSRERTASALRAIGKEEVDSIVAEQGGVAISCEFCGTEYNFTPAEISFLMERSDDSTH